MANYIKIRKKPKNDRNPYIFEVIILCFSSLGNVKKVDSFEAVVNCGVY